MGGDATTLDSADHVHFEVSEQSVSTRRLTLLIRTPPRPAMAVEIFPRNANAPGATIIVARLRLSRLTPVAAFA